MGKWHAKARWHAGNENKIVAMGKWHAKAQWHAGSDLYGL